MYKVNYVEANQDRVYYNIDKSFEVPLRWIYPQLKTWANHTYRQNILLAVF